MLQRCTACAKAYFPPRPFCPNCSSRAVEWFQASGKGTLHTYVINHRPAPGFEDRAPYAIAIVELAEGPHMMANIVESEQSRTALPIDLPLEVTFEQLTDEIALPQFRPAGGAR
jgi:uncharacterized OB-fold protein